jgi:hypothetical protein
MRKIIGWAIGLLLAVAVGVFGLQVIASETGEVVVLHTTAAGTESTTRLWVVEFDGDLWLRGGADSGWRQRLVDAGRAELERQGRRLACDAEAVPAEIERINALMAEKYGWRDRVIEVLVGGRAEDIPMRLRCAAV